MKKAAFHGFRIYRRELLPETFRRVLTEQLHQSVQYCGQLQVDPDTATHEIRKTTKRIRALYRIFHPVMEETVYRQGMEFYSKVSQVLADYRISRVYLDTLHELSLDKRIPVSHKYLSHLSGKFEKRHKQLAHKLFFEQRADVYLSDMVLATLGYVPDQSQFSCSFADLLPGLRKTYRMTRNNLAKAIQKPSTEQYHELRKAIKSLWNQLILIRPVWTSYLGLMIHNLDLVAQKLGHDHDLAEIEKVLQEEKTSKDADQRKLLLEFITKKRHNLQRSIHPLVHRLFAEKPGVFAGKMMVYHDQLTRPSGK